jgi:hypothetical protein
MVFGARTAVQGGFRFAGPSSSPEGEDSLVRVLVVEYERRLAAVVVAGLAMAVGGLALVAVLRDTPTREVRNATRLRATELATDLESGARPAELAVGGDPEDLLIQVLGSVARWSPPVPTCGDFRR